VIRTSSKALINWIFSHPKVARVALRNAMRLHNFAYDLCGTLSIYANFGVHPKHEIIRYSDWFANRVGTDSVVLDVGSNTGAMTATLAKKAAYVYGIELIDTHVEKARNSQVLSNLEYIHGDATTFDYSACRPFDCVTLSNVLEHIQDRVAFLKMLNAKLTWRNKEYRIFLIRVPTLERDWLAPYKKTQNVEYRLDRTHAVEHTRSQFLEELAAAGLSVREFEVRYGEFYAVCIGTL